jgi:hypothetical protein
VDYQEFKRQVNKAGLQINEFAALIDVHATSLSKYSNEDEVPPKYAVLAVLLGDVVDRKLMNVPEVLGRNGFKWPLGEKVTSIADYRGRPRQTKSHD